MARKQPFKGIVAALTAPFPIEHLRRRADFLAAARAYGCARGAVGAQARDREDAADLVRLGFTATKRIGGAVVRNRAKRRLREAARRLAPLHAQPGCDYVFIARGGTASRAWDLLLEDMSSALARLRADIRAARKAASPEPSDAPSDSPPPARAS